MSYVLLMLGTVVLFWVATKLIDRYYVRHHIETIFTEEVVEEKKGPENHDQVSVQRARYCNGCGVPHRPQDYCGRN